MDRPILANLSMYIRTALMLFLLIMLIYSLFSCSPASQHTELDDHLLDERTHLEQQIHFLQANINNDIHRIHTRYQNTNREAQVILVQTEEKLKHHYRLTENALKELETVTNGTWQLVSSSAHRILSEVRRGYSATAIKSNMERIAD